MPHVVVVGGGLAGCWAAATAAASGAEVTLVRRALGATAVSSGAIDAVPPAEAGDPGTWLGRLPREQPGHPYLAAGVAPGVDDLEAELGALAAALRRAGLGLRVALRAPALVAGTTGQVRLAGMLQQTIASGDLRRRAEVVVAGIAGLHRVDAAAVAAGIAARVPGLHALPLTLRVPLLGEEVDVDEAGAARALEAPGGAEALGRALQSAVDSLGHGVELVLVPPVLGLDDAEAVALRAYGAGGVPVAELLAPPPSPPGWRLQCALDRVTTGAGVAASTGTVVAVRSAGGRVTAAVTDAGDEVRCDALVLAGGRFLGGGLTLEARPREPLLGLPVFAGDRTVGTLARGDLVGRVGWRSQPVLSAGLRLDAGCRPVDGFGAAPWENVVACGSIVAGIDTTLDGGGLGVVAWTAGRAGRAAAGLAGVAAAA